MRYFIPVMALFALSLSACEGCQGGYLLQVQDSGSDGGFGYIYDTSMPDLVQTDSNLPSPVDAAIFLDAGDANDAQTAQDVLVSEDATREDQGYPDAWVKDQAVEDANIEDSHIDDVNQPDTALPDTWLPDTAQADTFVPECAANTTSCDGDHLIVCDARGLIFSDSVCAPFGCNAALIPNACRACDPGATHQCLNGEAVTCSSQGEIVTSEDCDFACNASRGVCNVCEPDSDSCVGDEIVHCGSDGLTADNPQNCDYGCGLHILSEDGGFIEDSGSEDAASLATITCNACRPSSARCEGEQSLLCDDSGEIAELRDCTFGCNPTSGECRACDPNAPHQCLNGQAVTCSSSGEIALAEDCAYGCDESDGLCDACDRSLPQQCQGDDAVTCSATGEVSARINCGVGECNPLAGQCNLCDPGQDFCAASGDIMACELDGSVGSLVQTCTYSCAEPVAGNPICLDCEPSTVSCHGRDLVTCDTAGNIDSSQTCSYDCAEAVGDDRCMECTASTTECHGDDSVVCSVGGYITTTTNCAYGCRDSDGQCNDCSPDTSACQGNDWVVCDATGHASSSDNCADYGDQCNAGICGASGCELDPVPMENASCDEGKFCSKTASCQSGTCTRTETLTCDDSNPCTQDRCDDAEGTNGACVYDSAPRDGADCEDGKVCTENTTCNNGNCEGGQALDCSDGNPCTEEHCEEPTGCSTPDSAGLENSHCGDESAGEEKICCSGTCINSDVDNCGACGDVCNDAAPCSAACMHYSCIEPDMLIITELMINPTSLGDTDGEWVEIYNPTPNDINIGDWVLEDGGNRHNTLRNFIVPSQSYAVLAADDSKLSGCSISNLYDYDRGQFYLTNSTNTVSLKAASCTVDHVRYDFYPAGKAIQLGLDHYADDNNDMANWCDSVGPSDGYAADDPNDPARMSCGGTEPYDYATPGSSNTICP